MKLSARERQLLDVLIVLAIVFLALQVFAIVWAALGQVADVLVIFGLAWAFSSILAPLVALLAQRTPRTRSGAVLVVYAAIFIAPAMAGAFATPPIAEQLSALAARAPELAGTADRAAKDFQ